MRATDLWTIWCFSSWNYYFNVVCIDAKYNKDIILLKFVIIFSSDYIFDFAKVLSHYVSLYAVWDKQQKLFLDNKNSR